MWINLNGELVSAEQPVLAHDNRAFRYGDALFETLKVVDRNPLFISDHIHRLTLSMHLLSMEPERHFTELFFEKEIRKLLEKNDWIHARVRITVFRNSAGFYTPEKDTAHFLIEAHPIGNPRFQVHPTGLSMTVYPDHYKPFNRLAGLKSANSLLYVLAGIWKRDHGYDELLIQNEQGRIAEAISSNIMIYKDGVVLTPAASEACLSGIMKEIVLVLVNRMNIDARPARITLEDIQAADEVWLTNMVQGVQWVSACAGSTYPHVLADRVVAALNAYAKL